MTATKGKKQKANSLQFVEGHGFLAIDLFPFPASCHAPAGRLTFPFNLS